MLDEEKKKDKHQQRPASSFLNDRPVVCILDGNETASIQLLNQGRYRMFRVIRSKGKQLASGGFGVTIAHHHDDDGNNTVSTEQPQCDKNTSLKNKDHTNIDNNTESITTTTTTTTSTTLSSSAEYLFIEEVLFLHERNYLRALIPKSVTTMMTTTTENYGLDNNNISNKNDPPKNNNDVVLTNDNVTPLDTSQLYQLLPTMGISLAVYRVYSHLRSQDFRVLRHDPNRWDILLYQQQQQHKLLQAQNKQHRQSHEQVEDDEDSKEQVVQQDIVQQKAGSNNNQSHGNEKVDEDNYNNTNNDDAHRQEQQQQQKADLLPFHIAKKRKVSVSLRRQVRESIQNSAPPSIPFPVIRYTNSTKVKKDHDNSNINKNGHHHSHHHNHNHQPKYNEGDTNNDNNKIRLCWDAYNPNSDFAKTHPGLPDFYVAATYYNVPTVKFTDLTKLIRERCNGIPLKVAAVSDSGTVVMFGITDYEIPPLDKSKA